MGMVQKLSELPGLVVTLDRLERRDDLQTTLDRPYAFVYYVTIHNNSDRAITVKGRKWVVEEQDGERLVLEGDGVVGQFPRIAPGHSFSYSSYHIVRGDSVVRGAYLCHDDEGNVFVARIPEFVLQVSGDRLMA
jgi:ApaG protein